MTTRRYRRLREVLDRRQPDLTVVLDQVNKPFNLSAILRTCDAVGVLEAHAITPRGGPEANKTASAGTGKWVPFHAHAGLEDAFRALKGRGMQVVAAHDSPEAEDFRNVDFTRPSALLLGAELYGPSQGALASVDRHVRVPMVGMVESLNVSAANAVLLYEAQRQRQAAGLYDRPRLDAATYWRTLFRWGYPKLARYCDNKGLPYPRLNEADGSLMDPPPEGAPAESAPTL